LHEYDETATDGTAETSTTQSNYIFYGCGKNADEYIRQLAIISRTPFARHFTEELKKHNVKPSVAS